MIRPPFRERSAELRHVSAWRNLADLILAVPTLRARVAEATALADSRAVIVSLWSRTPGIVNLYRRGKQYRRPTTPAWEQAAPLLAGILDRERIKYLCSTAEADLRFARNGIASFASRIAEDLMRA